MRLLYSLFVVTLCLLPALSNAQIAADTLVLLKSTDTVDSHLSSPHKSNTASTIKTTNPKKAGLYSLLLPGAGQLYNRQYWKIPIIYVGAGVAVYFYTNNQKNYQKYRSAYISRLDPTLPDKETMYSEQELKILQDEYKRWLDMTSLFTAVGYTLQVLDAVVFAHLKDFDISKDISMRLQPVAAPQGGLGLGLAFHIK